MKETVFNSEIMRSLKAHKIWCHKIADSPTSWTQKRTRFTPTKPCDILACYKGRFVAIEGKQIKKWKAFGVRDLRPSQIENLTAVVKAGGRSFIFLNVRIPPEFPLKRENRLVIIEVKDLTNEKWVIKAKDLRELPFYSMIKYESGEKVFDLSDFAGWIEKTKI